jgi:uncharacterized protein
MVHEQQLVISAPKERVWDFFIDPQQIARCMPGCEHVEPRSGNTYAARIVERVGPFRLLLHLEIRIDDMQAGRLIKAAVTGTDQQFATSFRQTLQATLVELAPDRTEVQLISETTIAGRIANLLGQTLMKRKAAAVISQFSQCAKAKLERP